MSADAKALITVNEGSKQTDSVKIESISEKELVLSKDDVKMICQPIK